MTVKARHFYCMLLVVSSCVNDPQISKSQKILSDFDSINKSLDRAALNVTEHSDRIYDSLLNKLSKEDFGMMRQLYYSVHDFYGYLQNLRWLFYKYCGDSSGVSIPAHRADDIGLTNSFITDRNYTAHLLRPQLEGVLKSLELHASSDSVMAMIRAMRTKTIDRYPSSDRFLKAMGENVPPTAFITILNSFELDIKRIETSILIEYYNN